MGIEDLSRHDEHNHHRLIRQLRAHGTPEDRRLANIFARCNDSNPCRSAACIRCGRDFQRVAFNLVQQEICGAARRDFRGRVSSITAVPTIGCLTPDGLSATACKRVMAKVTAALDACAISPYALSLDISFNEDLAGDVVPCAHVHGVRPNWFTVSEKADFKAKFPKSATVKRPVRVDELDRNATGRLYIFKPDRVRRVARDDGGRPDRRVLRPWQAVALAHIEHELGFEYRLVTHGIDENAIGAALDAFYRARDGP